MIIVSACLAGIRCNFEGKSNPCQKVIKLVKQGKAIPACPEILGGLGIPRAAAEKRGRKIVTAEGQEETREYLRGAKEVLRIAKLINCQEAILKARSPSCGSGQIYDGTFRKVLIKGDGVLTELLKKKGMEVRTEEEL